MTWEVYAHRGADCSLRTENLGTVPLAKIQLLHLLKEMGTAFKVRWEDSAPDLEWLVSKPRSIPAVLSARLPGFLPCL